MVDVQHPPVPVDHHGTAREVADQVRLREGADVGSGGRHVSTSRRSQSRYRGVQADGGERSPVPRRMRGLVAAAVRGVVGGVVGAPGACAPYAGRSPLPARGSRSLCLRDVRDHPSDRAAGPVGDLGPGFHHRRLQPGHAAKPRPSARLRSAEQRRKREAEVRPHMCASLDGASRKNRVNSAHTPLPSRDSTCSDYLGRTARHRSESAAQPQCGGVSPTCPPLPSPSFPRPSVAVPGARLRHARFPVRGARREPVSKPREEPRVRSFVRRSARRLHT